MAKRGPKPKVADIPCLNSLCKNYGKKGLGNVVSNGSYSIQDGSVRKLICRTCGNVFNDRKGSAFYDLRTPHEKVILGLKMLVKGASLRNTAEVLKVKLDTVRHWLKRAAENPEEINMLLLKHANVTERELDEFWSVVKKGRFREWRVRCMESRGLWQISQ
jgi:transposase-like protein